MSYNFVADSCLCSNNLVQLVEVSKAESIEEFVISTLIPNAFLSTHTGFCY